MPSVLAAALSDRIRDVASRVAPGWPDGADPATVFDTARARLLGIAASTDDSWRSAQSEWAGDGADAAALFTTATANAIADLVGALEAMSTATAEAAVAAARARARLDEILAEFENRAAHLETELDPPEADHAVAAEGRRALAEAERVVEQLRTELDAQAATVAAPTTGSPAATRPAGAALPGGVSSPPGTGGGSGGLGGGLGGLSGLGGLGALSGLGGSSGVGASTAAPFGGAPESARALANPDAGVFGDGVAITLPDGSTATAPNEVAASAVRHALTQLGVPYHWGGTAPGVGLDCSGLTQWAYGEAGLGLPRLAQEQDVGAPIDGGSLRPGDLAVWDGHVAMVVGNGLMVEAGDPVQLSPIRTSNAGQGFQGFWRPTG